MDDFWSILTAWESDETVQSIVKSRLEHSGFQYLVDHKDDLMQLQQLARAEDYQRIIDTCREELVQRNAYQNLPDSHIVTMLEHNNAAQAKCGNHPCARTNIG